MPAASGKYKGFKFRSLLEYSFMKHLERTGLVLGKDVLYENFRVPYRIGNGKQRDYIPDFYIVTQERVVEIKYSKYLTKKKEKAKIQAAATFFEDMGIEYKVYTEVDLGDAKMSLVEAAADVYVNFDRRTTRRVMRNAKKKKGKR